MSFDTTAASRRVVPFLFAPSVHPGAPTRHAALGGADATHRGVKIVLPVHVLAALRQKLEVTSTAALYTTAHYAHYAVQVWNGAGSESHKTE